MTVDRIVKTVLKSPWRRRAVALLVALIAVSVLWPAGVLPRLAGLVRGTPAGLSLTFLPGTPGTASWASNYEDFGELCNLSDLVVVGVADRTVEIAPAAWAHSPNFEFFDVRSAFRIDTVLKGKAGREITLTHTVMKTPEGWREAFAEDPPLRPGEKWVFFLRSGPAGYSELGPWGRYKIIDGKVYSMNRVLHDNNSYRAAGLDFDGIGLTAFLGEVKDTLDSVVMTFADAHNLPDRALRFTAGSYQEINVDLSTGRLGPAGLTYSVKRVAAKDSTVELPLPAELVLTITPASLMAAPHSQYRSILRIGATADLAAGTYWVCVEYRLGDLASGSRTTMVNIEAAQEFTPG